MVWYKPQRMDNTAQTISMQLTQFRTTVTHVDGVIFVDLGVYKLVHGIVNPDYALPSITASTMIVIKKNTNSLAQRGVCLLPVALP